MLPYERRKKILELLHQNDMVYLEEFQNVTNVSAATIRRDLKNLEADGQVEILSGGAAKLVVNIPEKSLSEKINLNSEQKELIASYASTMVKDGGFIFLGPGTTENHIIKHLEGKDVTVVTNGAFHIDELLKYNIKTFLLGGEVKMDIAVLVGPTPITQCKSINFDQCFIGASGVSLERGLSTSNLDVAELNKLVIKNSEEVIFMFDSTKVDVNSRYSFAKLEQANKLITTQDIKDKYKLLKNILVVE